MSDDKAKRGDLIIVREAHADTPARFTPYVVTSLTRDGQISRVRQINSADAPAFPFRGTFGWAAVALIKSARFHVQDACAEIMHTRAVDGRLRPYASARTLLADLEPWHMADSDALADVRKWADREAADEIEAQRCEHLPSELGCERALCNGVPTDSTILDVDVHAIPLTPVTDSTSGEDVLGSWLINAVRDVLRGEPSAMTYAHSRHYRLPNVRRAAAYSWTVSGRAVRVVYYDAVPMVSRNTMPHAAIYVDDVMIAAGVEGWHHGGSKGFAREIMLAVRRYVETTPATDDGCSKAHEYTVQGTLSFSSVFYAGHSRSVAIDTVDRARAYFTDPQGIMWISAEHGGSAWCRTETRVVSLAAGLPDDHAPDDSADAEHTPATAAVSDADASAPVPATPARDVRDGWAWGTAAPGGEWLTILGSAYRTPVLTATPAEAIKPDVLDQEWNASHACLARVRAVFHPGVTLTQTAYQILERADMTIPTVNEPTPAAPAVSDADASTPDAATPAPVDGAANGEPTGDVLAGLIANVGATPDESDADAPVAVAATPARVTFTLARAELADALAFLVKMIPSRVAVPVLGGLIFTADGGAVTVGAFNYEESRSAELKADDVTPGRILVGAKTLAEMIKSVDKRTPSVTITQSADGVSVAVTAGSARFSLPTMPVEDYPTMPDVPPTVGTADVSALSAMLTRVATAASTDATIPVLNTIYMVLGADRLTLDATDRYRLASADLAWIRTHDADVPVMLYARTFADVFKTYAKAAGKAGGTVTIGYQTDVTKLAFFAASFGPYTWITRTHEGTYPSVRSLYPGKQAATGTVDTVALTAAVKRVTAGIDKAFPVRLTWSANELTLSAGSKDATLGEGAAETLPCTFDGDDGFTTALNPTYVSEGLKAINAPTAVFGVNDSYKPAIISAPDATDFRYLVMSIRVGAETPAKTNAAASANQPTKPDTTTKPKGDTMPATNTPAKAAKSAAKRRNRKTATPAPANTPPATVTDDVSADNEPTPGSAETFATLAREAIERDQFDSALAYIEEGEQLDPAYLVEGVHTWAQLRTGAETLAARARAAAKAREDAEADALAAHLAELAARADNMAQGALECAARGEYRRALAFIDEGRDVKAGHVTEFEGGVCTWSDLRMYVNTLAERQATADAERAVSAAAETGTLPAPDALADATLDTLRAAYAAAFAALKANHGEPTPDAPTAVTVPATGAALTFTLMSWIDGAPSYDELRKQVRSALYHAGVTATVTRVPGNRRGVRVLLADADDQARAVELVGRTVVTVVEVSTPV